jgi:subtilisin
VLSRLPLPKFTQISLHYLAPGARLWSIKVLQQGLGTTSAVVAGIDCVTEHSDEIDVALITCYGIGAETAQRLALQASVAVGVVWVTSACDYNTDIFGYNKQFGDSDDYILAAYPEVCTVSGILDTDGKPGGLGPTSGWGADDTFLINSNHSESLCPEGNPVNSPGAGIDLAAPSYQILSTWMRTGYETLNDTPRAAAHVAGAAALYIAVHGKPQNAAGVAAVRQELINLGTPQNDPDGYTNEKGDTKPEPLLDVSNL